MSKNQKSLFDRLNEMSRLVEEFEKKAADPGDPGGYQGGSSHPSAKADNNGIVASEGERSSENESDVPKNVGDASLNTEGEATPGSGTSAEEAISNVSMNATTTGENPSVEDDYKGDKDDPGTGMPAEAGQGEKYSSMKYDELYEESIKLANEILADIATGVFENPTKRAAAEPTVKDLKNDPKAVKEAKQGYDDAAKAIDQEKAAMQELIANTIKQAQEDAALYGKFMHELDSGLLAAAKKAEDEEGESDDDDDDDESGEGGGESTPSAPPTEEAPVAPDAGSEAPVGPEGAGSDNLLAAMSGEMGGDAGGLGGGMPTEDPAAALGGMGGGMGGGMPPEAGGGMGGEMGGMPPEAGMGGEMGGGNEEMILQELIAALEEAGIGPEELAAIGPEGQKIASSVKEFKRSGGYQIKEAKTREQRNLRDMLKSYVIELVSRSN